MVQVLLLSPLRCASGAQNGYYVLHVLDGETTAIMYHDQANGFVLLGMRRSSHQKGRATALQVSIHSNKYHQDKTCNARVFLTCRALWYESQAF